MYSIWKDSINNIDESLFILLCVKFYLFLLTTPLNNCAISLGEVFFSARTTVTATAMEIIIDSTRWIPTIERNMYAQATPATIARPEVAIYLIQVRSDQIIESTDELTNAISVEKAAPSVP